MIIKNTSKKVFTCNATSFIYQTLSVKMLTPRKVTWKTCYTELPQDKFYENHRVLVAFAVILNLLNVRKQYKHSLAHANFLCQLRSCQPPWQPQNICIGGCEVTWPSNRVINVLIGKSRMSQVVSKLSSEKRRTIEFNPISLRYLAMWLLEFFFFFCLPF